LAVVITFFSLGSGVRRTREVPGTEEFAVDAGCGFSYIRPRRPNAALSTLRRHAVTQ
jgi:hypothetical protein